MMATWEEQFERFLPALSYEAPFLIQKLISEHIAETEKHANELFLEVKRYLILDRSQPERGFGMFSRRIDEAWHQFILFTKQYGEFCVRFFGRFVHHEPAEAPASDTSAKPSSGSTFEQFRVAYEMAYGIPLPALWCERVESVSRRVLHANFGNYQIRSNREMTTLTRGDRELMSVSAIAAPALEFITNTRSFYVRELPGTLTDDEKVALVSTLIDCEVLNAGT